MLDPKTIPGFECLDQNSEFYKVVTGLTEVCAVEFGLDEIKKDEVRQALWAFVYNARGLCVDDDVILHLLKTTAVSNIYSFDFFDDFLFILDSLLDNWRNPES